jgi:DNA-directed RNA polymerase subunit RPC12/RpoP
MFRKVGDKLMMAAAAKSGLVCPDCGAKTEVLPQSGSDVLTCPSCGSKASASEWSAREVEGMRAGRADSPPASTKIRKEGDGLGGVVWHIPASGKFGFFLLFAVFWLGITIMVSSGFLFAFLGGEKIKGDMPEWVLIPFFSIFYLVGFGMLYAGIRQKYMKHRLTVSGAGVTLRKELLGRTREKMLAADTLKSVTQEVFYSENYTPVYGIQIKGETGKIRFGSSLTIDEKAWLVADIHEVLFGAKVQAFHEGGERGNGKGVFSILIPGYGKHSWVGASLLSIMGIGFFIFGIIVIADDPSPQHSESDSVFAVLPRLFDRLDSVFLAFWSFISACFVIGGLVWLFILFRSHGSERRIEGNTALVSISTYRRGLVLKDESYPRNSIYAVRSSVSGSSNDKSMKRVELISEEKAIRLVSWLDGDQADDLVTELRAALGL